jgi:hypothetical protein
MPRIYAKRTVNRRFCSNSQVSRPVCVQQRQIFVLKHIWMVECFEVNRYECEPQARLCVKLRVFYEGQHRVCVCLKAFTATKLNKTLSVWQPPQVVRITRHFRDWLRHEFWNVGLFAAPDAATSPRIFYCSQCLMSATESLGTEQMSVLPVISACLTGYGVQHALELVHNKCQCTWQADFLARLKSLS